MIPVNKLVLGWTNDQSVDSQSDADNHSESKWYVQPQISCDIINSQTHFREGESKKHIFKFSLQFESSVWKEATQGNSQSLNRFLLFQDDLLVSENVREADQCTSNLCTNNNFKTWDQGCARVFPSLPPSRLSGFLSVFQMCQFKPHHLFCSTYCLRCCCFWILLSLGHSSSAISLERLPLPFSLT